MTVRLEGWEVCMHEYPGPELWGAEQTLMERSEGQFYSVTSSPRSPEPLKNSRIPHGLPGCHEEMFVQVGGENIFSLADY